MPNYNREFQIRTPERALAVIRGNLRDTVLEIHRLLSMANAVVSACLREDPSRPLVTGYMDGSGRIDIHRYLNSGSGTEFENWLDADPQQLQSLPEGAWKIKRFVRAAPPMVVLGEAVLTASPHELPRVDFAQESGIHGAGSVAPGASRSTAENPYLLRRQVKLRSALPPDRFPPSEPRRRNREYGRAAAVVPRESIEPPLRKDQVA